MGIITKNWYVIYTRPFQERRAFSKLEQIGLKCLLPMSAAIHTWRDRKKRITSPLFPSYVFIYLNNIREYYDSLDVEGVLRYVRFGSEIAIVGQPVIDNLEILTRSSPDLEVTSSRIQEGKSMVISRGPLTGLSCEIVEYKGGSSVLVRVNLLQRNILMSVPEISVEELAFA